MSTPTPSTPAVTTPTPTTPATPTLEAKSKLAELLDEPAAHVWYRRPVVWGSVVLVALIAAGIWYWQVRKAADAAPSYSTQLVARGNLTLTVAANGTIQPARSISIGSELSGTVLKVNVDVNDPIKKGQVLVVFDTAKLRDQILRSKAAVAAASAKVQQTAATIKEQPPPSVGSKK